MDDRRSTIGYIEEGRVLNANQATLGYYEGGIPEEAALFFFFFFGG